MDHAQLTLIVEYKKTSAQYKKLLMRAIVPCTFMDVKIHVITVDEAGILNIIAIDRATLVPKKAHVTTRIAPILDPLTRTTVSYEKDMECKKPPEYVAVRIMHHLHATENLVYRVHSYECTPAKDNLEPDSYNPCHCISRY